MRGIFSWSIKKSKKSPVGLDSQGKFTNYTDQFQRVRRAFSFVPKTMLQVSIETGILRANICRYVARMKKQESIFLDRKGICPISKHRAGFYTTSQDYGR